MDETARRFLKLKTVSIWLQFSTLKGEIRDTKTLNLSRNIVSLQVFVDVSRFSPCVINLSRNKRFAREKLADQK